MFVLIAVVRNYVRGLQCVVVCTERFKKKQRVLAGVVTTSEVREPFSAS